VTAALWWALQRLAECPGALWYFPEPSLIAFALALIGAAWLLSPRGMPARALGLALLLPLLAPARQEPGEGEFVVDVLDVGQGLAVLLRTREHALLYDAGARYPSGFDLGDAAVVPALHALGVTRLDRLIVSHGDNDHAGGAAAVMAAFPGADVASGEPERLHVAARQCLAGENWNWNGIAFRIVHPHEPLANKANDRCCVLDVRGADTELLLTGDITAAVEDELARSLPPLRPYRVLQVPHHGSKTSSSETFLDAFAPQLAPISAGYRNAFHHPHAVVLARYAAHGVPAPVTAEEGFLEIAFPAAGAPTVRERGRRARHPYWRE
jgi:competence protein ComEC